MGGIGGVPEGRGERQRARGEEGGRQDRNLRIHAREPRCGRDEEGHERMSRWREIIEASRAE